ncbi:malonic semialdehyde reductase [Luedemannella helvata]|uniref:Malonic semialdehyde reductase n=1 Tax=Luedemannella helvata TaxID=349315 RepID=A0ABP4WBS8_9ACTN
MTAPAIDRLHLSPDAADLLFREARTANAFTDEPVTDDHVRAIYDLAKYAPTAMNQQPLRLVLVRSEEARARLVGHMAPGNRDKTAAAPLVAIVAADTRFHDELPRVFPHAPGARELFADPHARENSARFNAAIQLGFLILAIRAAGLAAGPMGGYDAAGINADFFPDGEHRVVAVVNIGRPAADAWRDRLPRLAYDEVVTTV